MRRYLLAACVLASAAQAYGQSWAEKMFVGTSHDFGNVPRSAKVQYEFQLTNLYKDDVHISGVRSSCGCTLPRVEKNTLKSWEQGSIIAEFNTRAFSGQHGARVTVTIDKPYFAEVSLEVKGYIRTDVMVEPGQVAFGTIDEGKSAQRKVTIDYTGGNDWRVTEIKPTSANLNASFKEIRRSPGRTSYEVTVNLTPEAPAGYLHDQLVLLTNDSRSPEVVIMVDARVAPELTVSPSPLMLGVIQPGQTVTKQLLIRAKRPFLVTGLKADGGVFSFGGLDKQEAKQVHVVPVTFTADSASGKITHRIHVETDLGPKGVADVEAFGEVAAPLAGK